MAISSDMYCAAGWNRSQNDERGKMYPWDIKSIPTVTPNYFKNGRKRLKMYLIDPQTN